MFNINNLTVLITGLSCSNCAPTIWSNVRKLRGVKDVNVDFARERLTMSFDPAWVSKKEIIDCIRRIGYDVVTTKTELTITGIQDNTNTLSLDTRKELQKAYNEVELQEKARTEELVIANKALQDEIIERKKAEESLRLSEEYFRNIFENILDVYYETTLDGTIIELSPSIEAVSNGQYHRADLIGKSMYDFYTDSGVRDKVIALMQKTGSINDFEVQLRNRDGGSIACTISAKIYLNTEGKIEKIIGSMHNITKRKLTEISLRESEKKLREAQEMAHLGSWNWDIKSGNIEWSDEVYKIFKLDPNKFTPHIDSILALSPWPENHQRGQELINQAIANHEQGSYEQKFLRPDNTIGHYYSTFQGNYDENGALISIFGTILDITERKLAEETLRENEERYRLISEVVSDYIFTSKLDSNEKLTTTWVTGAFERITGYSLDEYIAAGGWRGTLHPDDREKDNHDMEELLKNHQVVTDVRTYAKNGNIVWVRVYAHPLWDFTNNKLVGIYGGVKDITENKLAENALAVSENRLRTLIQTIPDLIWLKDVSGVYLSCNPVFERLFGAKETEIVGKTDYDFIDAESANFFRENDRMAMEAGKTISNEEWVTFADGHRILIETSKTPMYDSNGTLIGVLGIGHDITNRKLNEEALKESERLLRESQTVAHLGSYVWNLSAGLWQSSKILDEIFGINENYNRSLNGWVNIIHPEWQKIMSDYITNDVLGKRQRFDKEYLIIRQNDRQERWVHGIGTLEFDNDNNPIKLIGTISDITDRKQAEEEIQKQLNELRRWYEVTLDREGRVLELKNEVNKLLKQIGEPLRYGSAIQDNPEIE